MHKVNLDTKEYPDQELVSMHSETIGGQQSQNSLWAQAELTRRLIESNRNLSKSNDEYSERLLRLTIILALIAVMQLLAAVFALDITLYTKYIVTGLAMFLIGYAAYDSFKEFKSK